VLLDSPLLTLLTTDVFAVAVGASLNYIALRSLSAVRSVGVGGILQLCSSVHRLCALSTHPSDGARAEFIPVLHQCLTMLFIWWGFGQLLGRLVVRRSAPIFSCPANELPCPAAGNLAGLLALASPFDPCGKDALWRGSMGCFYIARVWWMWCEPHTLVHLSTTYQEGGRTCLARRLGARCGGLQLRYSERCHLLFYCIGIKIQEYIGRAVSA